MKASTGGENGQRAAAPAIEDELTELDAARRNAGMPRRLRTRRIAHATGLEALPFLYVTARQRLDELITGKGTMAQAKLQ